MGSNAIGARTAGGPFRRIAKRRSARSTCIGTTSAMSTRRGWLNGVCRCLSFEIFSATRRSRRRSGMTHTRSPRSNAAERLESGKTFTNPAHLAEDTSPDEVVLEGTDEPNQIEDEELTGLAGRQGFEPRYRG